MKRYLTLNVIVLFAFLFISSCIHPEKPKPVLAEELSQINRDFASALYMKDAVAFASLYA